AVCSSQSSARQYLHMTSVLYSFILPSSPPHPYLHSFPTRRSSDLLSGMGFPVLERAALRTAHATAKPYDRKTARRSARSLGRCRSEEHTSELQSRFDLVCRLLLEKKKKKSR